MSGLSLSVLNSAPASELQPLLLTCCSSPRWVETLLSRRPFTSLEDVLSKAAAAWQSLSMEEWKAALLQSPQLTDAVQTATLAAFSGEELRAIAESPGNDQAALKAACDEYERAFGHRFFIAAYGLSAAACLAAVNQRKNNSKDYELILSVQERSKVIQRRLTALLAAQPGSAAPASLPASLSPAGLNIAVSTHVLNTSNGLPAANMRVTFEAQSPTDSNSWLTLGTERTNADGRIGTFPPIRTTAPTANYRLVFESSEYLSQQGNLAFFPQITIVWAVSQVLDKNRAKLHVPLLLSPYGYSTYRGS